MKNHGKSSLDMKEDLGQDVDYGSLAAFLSALAYPTRLELLRILRFPHIASDIKVSPLRIAAGENPARAASKQTIQAHLDKLVDAGLVRVEASRDGLRGAHVYTVNSQKVYAVTEDLRKVSAIYAGRGAIGDITGTVGVAAAGPTPTRGPRLVLVHGPYEGKAHLLDARNASDGCWLIGRRRGIAVSLDYDPYVSLDNSKVRQRGDHYTIEDLPGSKNGTAVNWDALPKGQPHRLEPGDVIGIGRSLLVYTRT